MIDFIELGHRLFGLYFNGRLSVGDIDWLLDNEDIVTAFFKIADKERKSGRKTGSWLVANQVRWETRHRESSGRYKINNNHISLLAHTYNCMPEREGYFATRKRKQLEYKK